jgi:hypothetical protein
LADDPCVVQPAEFARPHAQDFVEHLLGVLAQSRRRSGGHPRHRGEVERQSRGKHLADARLLDAAKDRVGCRTLGVVPHQLLERLVAVPANA